MGQAVNTSCAKGCKAIRHQILAGGVSDGWRSVNQDVMPRLIAVRLTLVFLVPRFVGSAGFVNSDDDSAITVAAMLNQRSDFETLALASVVESNHSFFRTVWLVIYRSRLASCSTSGSG